MTHEPFGVPTPAVIEARIKEILASQLEISLERLTGDGPDMILIGRGVGLDSVEALALATRIEAEFGIQFADDDLTIEQFANLGSLAVLVSRRLANRKPA